MSKSGQKLINLVGRKDPFKKNCTDNGCPPCESLDAKNAKVSNCKLDNVTYKGICKTCELQGKVRVYDGETARNLHVRSKEHISQYDNNNKNSWMLKHVNNEHNGEKDNVEFKWKVVRKHNKPLERQVSEAVNIDMKKEEENLNSKSEFNHQSLRRLCIDRKRESLFDCKTCGALFENIGDVNEHTKMFHAKYKCIQCDYSAIGDRDLKYHVQVTHKSTI